MYTPIGLYVPPDVLPLVLCELFELPELPDEEPPDVLPELVLLLGFLLFDMAPLIAPAAAPAMPAMIDAKPILCKPPVL